MKRFTLSLAAVAVIACGCQRHPPGPQQHADVNVALVRALNQSAVDEAIIVQHTIYPYHFVRHSAQLNRLGERDLGILLNHYLSFPSPEQPLNIRRGPEPEPLYAARVETILTAVTAAGVDADRIDVRDGLPGGAGMASDRVILIHAADRATVTSGGTATHGATKQ
jgi:hypothetical protein